MRLRHLCRLAALGLVGAILVGAPVQARPQRVVSMNLCTDQLAMLVAAPDQLISVSYLARDPKSSPMAERAAKLHANHGQAEEIAFLRPDLVLAGRYTTRVTVDMLNRLGYQVAIFEPENSLEDIASNLRRMGEVLGRVAEAEAMAAQIEGDIARLRAAADPKPEAAIWYAMGYTAGARSLGHDIVTTAGLENIAVKRGLGRGGVLPLESLILSDPHMVIRSAGYEGHSRAQEMLSHPALEQILQPPRLSAHTRPEWTCGTPLTIDAIHQLRSDAGLEPLR